MNSSQKQILKKKAHQLKPIVLIGSKGLTQAVHNEIDRALEDHELIKIKVQATDREARTEMTKEICEQHGAVLVQVVGHIITIYREKQDN